MKKEEIMELAKAAAHSAVLAQTSIKICSNHETAVDCFLEAYKYAFEKITQMTNQTQNNNNPEFESNVSKFR